MMGVSVYVSHHPSNTPGIVSSMNTNGCVCRYRGLYFIARRGVPNVIFSANGSNFVWAEKAPRGHPSLDTTRPPHSWARVFMGPGNEWSGVAKESSTVSSETVDWQMRLWAPSSTAWLNKLWIIARWRSLVTTWMNRKRQRLISFFLADHSRHYQV